jgi:VCBS repeat-containing protein
MTFGPSGDTTDDPAEMSLYIADSGLGRGAARSFAEIGHITELSFDIPAVAPAMLFAPEVATLVQTIETSQFSPPSPDPAGITWVGNKGHLLISDSEVNEMSIFQDVNLFEIELDGNLLETGNTTIHLSNREPTGVTWNPANNHIFISNDDKDEIYEMDAGSDGVYGTTDDIVTSFDTQAFESFDPEGLTYDTSQGVLYIVDGVNAEVYRVSPGSNGVFDGVPPAGDDVVTSFDTEVHGLTDPEGIAYDADPDHLYIAGKPRHLIFQITTTGMLARTIDITAANPDKPAGLARAPSSVTPGEMNLYAVDRRVDNGSDPNENDGQLYEFSFPPFSGNIQPMATITGPANWSTYTEGDPVTFTGTAMDAEDGDLTASLTWTSSRDGTIGSGGSFTTSGLSLGTHTITADVTDSGGLQSTDAISVVVVPAGVLVLEARGSASSDDAEESNSSGSVGLTSSDLELVRNQTVGMRFNTVTIPAGATIYNAYIQFQADETGSLATSLTLQAEATDNAETFSGTAWNISSRNRTAASVSWVPVQWTTVGDAGIDQRTPDISSLIQEIVSRPGWSSGNSLAIIVTGQGERTAESYDGDRNAAPVLRVYYLEGSSMAPEVTIAAPADGSTFNEGYPITFTGTAMDNQDGDLTASLTWTSSLDGEIGSGGSFSTGTLSVGVHDITASATNSQEITGTDQVTVTVFAHTAVLVGAGDMTHCERIEDDETARMLETVAGTVITLGDNAYPNGTDAEFAECYDPTWGRHKTRTRPSAGNHDYYTPGASGYFNYFGAAAGDPDKGYYSYDVGDWHIIVLNSECNEVGGCDLASPQGQWLQADLTSNPTSCTAAYWHKPRFSSDLEAPDPEFRDFWQLLYDAGADIVLHGHEHFYERFDPQDPDANADPRGIRQFIVGTGGGGTESIDFPGQPNSVIADRSSHGIIKLTLHPTSYDWEFIPIPGDPLTDSGSASCVTANDPPVAVDDVGTVAEGGTLNQAAPGVLANDSDPDGDPLTVNTTPVTPPTNGSLTLNANGSYDYTHDGGETTSDVFVYEISDGNGGTATATVNLTITAVNDPPVAFDDVGTVAEGGTLNEAAPGVLGKTWVQWLRAAP